MRACACGAHRRLTRPTTDPQPSGLKRSAASRLGAMAQYTEHIVLIGGLHRDTRSGDLWRAIESAGLRPSVLACPTDMLVHGFSYVVFHDRVEAIAAAALSGVMQLHDRVLTLELQVDRCFRIQAAQPAVVPHADGLRAALGPIIQPLTATRQVLRIRRVHHLRFHEEYYGVYLQIAQDSILYEGHVTLLHCLGCAQRLTREQIRRIEARCMTLQARPATLADVPMTLVMRRGRLHRGFCTVHIQTALSRELWGIRGLLSAWIPEATSDENRENFHLSFDRVTDA